MIEVNINIIMGDSWFDSLDKDTPSLNVLCDQFIDYAMPQLQSYVKISHRVTMQEKKNKTKKKWRRGEGIGPRIYFADERVKKGLTSFYKD